MPASHSCAIAATLAFIDASLPEIDALILALPAGVDVQLLPAGRNGLEFMAQALCGRSGIETMHLIGHVAPGTVQLGSATLQRSSLPHYLNTLDILRDAMVADGQLLIYGCEVAQGTEGSRFLEALCLMTGLQVTAVSHKQDERRACTKVGSAPRQTAPTDKRHHPLVSLAVESQTA